jgi:hypothetical protein
VVGGSLPPAQGGFVDHVVVHQGGEVQNLQHGGGGDGVLGHLSLAVLGAGKKKGGPDILAPLLGQVFRSSRKDVVGPEEGFANDPGHLSRAARKKARRLLPL